MSTRPFGIVLGHNGNLTNAEQLKQEMFLQDLRHINTGSDSEVLLNTLAHELQTTAKGVGWISIRFLPRFLPCIDAAGGLTQWWR
jgi:glutamine phosphoribosylpyrophosphate amidotransferase